MLQEGSERKNLVKKYQVLCCFYNEENFSAFYVNQYKLFLSHCQVKVGGTIKMYKTLMCNSSNIPLHLENFCSNSEKDYKIPRAIAYGDQKELKRKLGKKKPAIKEQTLL